MINEVDNVLAVHFPYLLRLLRCPFECLFKRLTEKEAYVLFSFDSIISIFFFKILFKNLTPDLVWNM